MPAGWYPDPRDRSLVRWWDGSGWSEQTTLAYVSGERPDVSPQTPVDTPYIWVVVLAPIVSLIALLFWNPTYSLSNPLAMYDAAYFLVVGLGWLVYAAMVVFSYLDWRTLRSRGVVRPFHWAWSFLSSIVYVIGRYVILRKVAQKRGFGPLLVLIIVAALGFIAGIVKSVQIFEMVFSTLPTSYS
jgi:hypothetical protein